MIDWMKKEHKTESGLDAVVNRTVVEIGKSGTTFYATGYVWDDACGRPGPMIPCQWERNGEELSKSSEYDLVESGHA